MDNIRKAFKLTPTDKDKRIEELEKENAELKRERKRLNDNYHYWNIKACHIDQELYDTKQQLTKAKELLKKFIETSNPIYFEEDRQKVKAEAEQFISEVEKNENLMEN